MGDRMNKVVIVGCGNVGMSYAYALLNQKNSVNELVLIDLDKEAVAKVVEYASQIAGDKQKISTHFNSINEVVGEAATWAKLKKSKVVTKEFVQKALDERIERIKKYDTKYLEMVEEETLLIDTDGYRCGQINGLTVISIGDYSFRKTCKSYSKYLYGK